MMHLLFTQSKLHALELQVVRTGAERYEMYMSPATALPLIVVDCHHVARPGHLHRPAHSDFVDVVAKATIKPQTESRSGQQETYR